MALIPSDWCPQKTAELAGAIRHRGKVMREQGRARADPAENAARQLLSLELPVLRTGRESSIHV